MPTGVPETPLSGLRFLKKNSGSAEVAHHGSLWKLLKRVRFKLGYNINSSLHCVCK